MKDNTNNAYGKEIAMTVLGAGSYGTSLAISLARNGANVVIWGHEPEHMARLEADRANHEFLPGIEFPQSLIVESDLEKAVQASRDLLVVVPSHVFGIVLNNVKPFLRDDSRICWATKGLEPETGRLLKEVAHESLGEGYSLAVLSGPTFAKELAMGMPTAISVASPDADFVADLQEKIHCSKTFRVYANSDFIGMQLGGAVKNVIAIGAGMSDGIGFGANARTALITRGLAEMTRLGAALGAQPETFMGMAGLGDLVLTCTDNQSRNRRFGLALGQGKDVDTAQEEIGQVVEGYRNTKEVFLLAERMGVEMPIVDQIYQVLYQGKDANLAAKDLLARDKKAEA
ncbi:NAD(P)H-dependent glycerol-3-phosphate dehydrogenase [Vibrio brasiliensis]|jgi:glycerol-3-phosphate dehydrogenase (NAD(P)+)|uniref:Glycerol-3-phosphate dehydrogenase [NAD(P)+] n=1 Tax=Vibrio brasiliensis LMG 20546 TaxID=945543 RepID=E8LXX9_9VIBR|nr:NAD(P)H-dependent glycerol-3-phosphate dehydrogenase [Vibrio brasiliensis]EGA64446.1 NAD(P)H-dependent glycerol-3-phosphate dehydrogenase [Vibrio brasiliensis LMG 20546]MCG9651121.1 NAD(P)H-dependent glycerol-3-phosphate dehydrogenase [Vibrio brasiliensis]MCG9727986.1 NAD(P)H-dependent glycerol-3-phosphate dehydrogenase [Vibrio brasiliensis]MCG9752974.1 NAD(P)H-dependent glycerol-3-phosphate dehydrogenase [Vibrio brasiliensis]MCG9785024.1 NAD(P)H-dependent glycerol-3-phosphate dehydrogenase|tara:strand:- start:778 stop:1809 length:1032 start_codon:yes stop_codon:yes gene_type:complete